MKQVSHWIDGAEVAGTGERRLPVYDPATGERQADVVAATDQEVRAAVLSARAAQAGWRAASLSRRAEVMFRFRDLVDANRKEIAILLSAEHGKTVADAAADAAVSAGFGSAGERCMAVSVVVAVGSVGDALVDAIASRIGRIRVGPATDPDAEMGPLITAEHRDRVRSYLDEPGGRIVVDGRAAPAADGPGFFLGASLVDHVDTDSAYYTDEIFGPVLSVVRVDTYDEAVDLVNRSAYGNGTAIFTRDGGAARRFQYDVVCGMVGVNSRWPDPATSEVDLGFPKVR